jgi:hypothetical protein
MSGISFVEPGLREIFVPVQNNSCGCPISPKEYVGLLVFGDEKTKVAKRNETTIGGLAVLRTDSYTFVSKVVFVSMNKATGK